MSRKQRRKNRQGKAKQRRAENQEQTPVIEQPIIELAQEMIEDHPERFVHVNEIAERLGVGATAVRQWGRQGKLELRKLFGTTGMYGMPESQLIKIINGENEG